MANLGVIPSTKLYQLLSILKLKSFDTSTFEGRGKERYRRVALTAIGSAAAKIINLTTNLITIPLTYHYLEDERYGLWLTISSLLLFLNFADLGIGNGLLNKIAEACGKDERKHQTYISSAFFSLLIFSIFLFLVFFFIYPHINWIKLYRVSSPEIGKEAGIATAAFVFFALLNIPLGVSRSVQQGMQEGFVNYFWQALASLFSLLGVLITIFLKGGLVFLVISAVGFQTLILLINGVYLFFIKYPNLRPHLRSFDKIHAVEIAKIGLLFFILQISVSITSSSDNLIIAQFIDIKSVPHFSVPFRLFSYASLSIYIFLEPLWPAYREAIARKDFIWVRNSLLNSVKFAILASLALSILLLVMGSRIIHFWVGDSINPSRFFLLGLGIWTVISASGNAIAMFLNGANIIRLQVICALLVMTSAIAAKILFIDFMGLPGVTWGTVVAYTLFAVLPYLIFTRKVFARLNEQ